ncbi:MAG: Crp/Fnr family transcriptional regulator [Myxococcales bacterium]|nr:Crp/Fnr family transcriptional regulator [Myxococcales bacterium]
MMNEVWHVQQVDWFQELSPEETEKLRRASVANDYGPGEMVFSPEPRPRSVYLLEAGRVRIFRLSPTGSETTFGYVTPGEVFGELAGLGDYPRESFAQTVSKSRAWKIPRMAFQQLLKRQPRVILAITRQIGARLKRIESRVEDLAFRDVRSRVAHVLLELAEDFGRRDDEGLVIETPPRQGELATLVGSTRQTVNATLRELETEGLIGRRQRRIVLRRPEALRLVAVSAPDS